MSLFQPSRGNAGSTAFQPTPGSAGGRASPSRPRRPGSTPGSQPGRAGVIGYEAVRASRDFSTIQRRFGSFVRPACVLFILWYFLFVIIAVFAPGFMRASVAGDVDVGLCFGVLQFVSTFAIAMSYRRRARRRLDPLSDRLRHRLEAGQQHGPLPE
jgi:uncharacterized membrane protein (DUF485 family)